MFGFKTTAKKKTNFRFAKIITVTKTWKTTFPKEFFDETWLKLKEHEYLNNFLNKIWKKKICLKMAAKTSFVTLRNNARIC